MRRIVSDKSLDTLFRAARDHHAWLARPISDTLLRALWELVKRGPASGDARSARLVFGRSREIKEQLAAAVPGALRAGLLAAPVVAIIGSARGVPSAPQAAGLAAGSVIFAARALGLDCGPVWDIDSRAVDAACFPEGGVAAAVLCAIGYGAETPSAADRGPPAVEEACRIL
jgi:3-hydroxypropanoate dehydrogenase